METMIDAADKHLLRAVVTCNSHALLGLFPPILAKFNLILDLGPITSNPPERDNINQSLSNDFFINANCSFLTDCNLSLMSLISVKRIYDHISRLLYKSRLLYCSSIA